MKGITMQPLTIESLKASINEFISVLSTTDIPELYGITDGKAVGTHIELLFNNYLKEEFTYTQGSAATGIDFPSLYVDLNVTSIRQAQWSCPFRPSEQKGYDLEYLHSCPAFVR